MDTYINRILNITNSNYDEKTIKDDIQDDLDLIFELYHDRKDTRLRSIQSYAISIRQSRILFFFPIESF